MAWLDFRAVLSTTWYVHHSFHLFGDLFSISTSGIVKFDTSIMVDSHDNRCLFADTSWGKEVHISNWYHDCSCIQGCSCSTVGLITSAIYSCMLHIVQCLLTYIFCTLWYVGRMRINCYMCTATRYGKWCGYLGGNTWVIEWFIGEPESHCYWSTMWPWMKQITSWTWGSSLKIVEQMDMPSISWCQLKRESLVTFSLNTVVLLAKHMLQRCYRNSVCADVV
jgi:hypothetical protein